jgi:hypothetical protein
MSDHVKGERSQSSKVSKTVKKPYEKPRVTTLGRVADLTNGGGGSVHSDAFSTKTRGSDSKIKRD